MTKKRCLQNFYILGNSDSNDYLPMSATLVSEEIYKTFQSLKSYFSHGFTHSKHPVCTAVAMVNSDILVKKKLIEKAASLGIYLK